MRRIFGSLLIVFAMVFATLTGNPAQATAASPKAAAQSAETAVFKPLRPARLLDTRSGLGVARGPVKAGSSTPLRVTGRSGVPATGVAAVVLNVTVAAPAAGGFVTVWPRGTSRPTASNLNFVPRQNVANQVIVKVGTSGLVDLFSSAGTQMFIDISGYYPTGSGYTPLVPARLLDTRRATSHPVAKSTTTVKVTGVGGVPSTGVSAVVVNVTAIPRAGSGWLNLFPAGVTRPNASIVNYAPRQATAGMGIAKVGANGQVQVYSSQAVDLLVDVAGWVPAKSGYSAMTPMRVADTRNGTGGVAVGRVKSGGVLSLPIASGGVVSAGRVSAVEINVTAT
ncbi:MAG: hypothetical protein ABI360_10050, partial [Allobranchiibius sp.]